MSIMDRVTLIIATTYKYVYIITIAYIGVPIYRGFNFQQFICFLKESLLLSFHVILYVALYMY